MTKQKEEIVEETLPEPFSFEKSMNILKNVSLKIAKEQKKFDEQKQIPSKPGEKGVLQDSEARDIKQLLSLEKQYSIILGSAMRFINPVLKNWRIDPLNNKEIDDLSKAILRVSEGNVKKTVQKIEKRFSALGKLSKYIELISVFWEIALPRFSQFKVSLRAIRAKQEGAVKQ